MNKMLIVSQHFWPESFRINDLTDYFIERGYGIDVLCGMPNYPKGKFYDGYSYIKNRKQVHNKINIIRSLEIPRGKNSNIEIFLNYVSYPILSLLKIPGLLRNKYDKIFIYQTSPVLMGLPGIIIGKIKKIETIMYVLDLWPENLFSVLPIQNKFLKKLITKVSLWHYKKVDKIVVLSEKMKQIIIERTNISPEKVLIMPQCCEKFYENDIVDKQLQQKYNKGFNIVFAGNMSPAQSFETILYAAKKLQAENIHDINWIMVGDGMSRKQIEEYIKENKLKGFYFEGFQKPTDIPKYHTIADALIACLVKSNLLECTIPAKVMSYIAAGKPILLAMDGEVQELINKQAQCGFACNAEDGEILYQNIRKLYYMTKEERNELGRRAKAYHYEHFERDSNLDKLEKFIFN